MTLSVPSTTTVSSSLLAVISKQYSTMLLTKFIGGVVKTLAGPSVNTSGMSVMLQLVPYDILPEHFLLVCSG